MYPLEITRPIRDFLCRGATALLAAALLATLVVVLPAGLAQAQTGPVVTTDRMDYYPNETVVITGSGFAAGEIVTLVLVEDPPLDPPRTLYAQADASGGFVNDEFITDIHDIGVTFTLTATGVDSGLTAQTVFTDGPANLDQWANVSIKNSTLSNEWVNGALVASKSTYVEGDSVPYRATFNLTDTGPHTITIEWDTTKAGKHAIDYITTFNRSVPHNPPLLNPGDEGPVLPCGDPYLSPPPCGSPATTFAIPSDPQVTGAGVPQIPGVFTMYGGTITDVSDYTYADGAGFTGDKSARITISFTADVTNPVLLWGGHIATRMDWGTGNSAIAITGDPYHTRLISLDTTTSLGNQDRALSAEAVIFPGEITIIKDATPNGNTSFPFTASPSPLANFSLVDDGTTANTKTFSNILLFPNTGYTVTETADPAWTFNSISCDIVQGLDTTTVDTSGATVTINLKEGAGVTCTYTNTVKGHIVVKKVTNPDPDPTDTSFTFTTTGSGYSGFSLKNTEQNNSGPLVPGTYTVAETPVSGWTLASATCDKGQTPGNISLLAGETVTCTFTNTKEGSIKIVKNTAGGDDTFAFTSNFGVSSITTTSGTGSQTVDNLSPGSGYNIVETAQTGWDEGTLSCDHGTPAAIQVLAGELTTCSITNTKQGSIKVVKTAVGGDGTFSFTSNFGVSSITTSGGTGSQTINNLSVGSGYNISEQALAGWDKGTFSCDHGTPAAIQVLAGELTTCSITNTKQGSIKVVKTAVGGDGTFSFTSNFGVSSITTTSGTGSQTVGNLSPGSGYNIVETAQTGWDEGTFSCDNGTASAITVVAGQLTTCTITNTMRGQIIVKKVTNPSGDSQSFSFTASYYGSAFNLTDGGSNTSGLLPAGGGYSVSETTPTGWDLTGHTCDNGNDPSAITLGAGRTVTCTFTNTKRALVEILKTENLNPPSVEYTFSFGTAAGSPISCPAGATCPSIETRTLTTSIGNGALDFTSSGNGGPVPPGTYQLCEVMVPAGTTSTLQNLLLFPDAVVNSTTGTVCASITLAAGDTKNISIDNIHPLGGQRTIGYWKNWNTCANSSGNQVANASKTGHVLLDQLLPIVLVPPNGTYPGVIVTTCEKAVEILTNASGKYAEHALAAQLLAAVLNRAVGGSCQAAEDAITHAQVLLQQIGWNGLSSTKIVDNKHPLRSDFTNTEGILDKFNNGLLCN